jgi:hypothetical protein
MFPNKTVAIFNSHFSHKVFHTHKEQMRENKISYQNVSVGTPAIFTYRMLCSLCEKAAE